MTPKIKINRPSFQEAQNYLKLSDHYALQENALKKYLQKFIQKMMI
ncbi:hypothetical protein [Campylobacter sp. CCS1377]|uniref:Uncharacterized protein n=1 Tax=Campylobacter sp. CCS1377 TaxID=3158229 RepID=A0AAU7E5D7_9BACT|nr:hypothetical protein [Campylobacter jejuni]